MRNVHSSEHNLRVTAVLIGDIIEGDEASNRAENTAPQVAVDQTAAPASRSP